MMNPNVAALVVTYNPEVNSLLLLLEALADQVDAIVIVDNGSSLLLRDIICSRHRTKEVLICLGKNLGIAAAFNAGIEWARKAGKAYVILFDQDSFPAPDMVAKLMSAIRQLQNKGVKVAAVGPRYEDLRNPDLFPFIRISGMKVQKQLCRGPNGIVASDAIISSGSLIPLSALNKVGGPLDELFIDQVDLEWCFRARSYGYGVFGICNAVLGHSLGETPLRFFGRKFIHQSPLRHYYIFRNAVWLVSKKYVPPGWKFLFMRSILVRSLVYTFCVSPRLVYLRMMSKGIYHGLLGRLGKLH